MLGSGCTSFGTHRLLTFRFRLKGLYAVARQPHTSTRPRQPLITRGAGEGDSLTEFETHTLDKTRLVGECIDGSSTLHPNPKVVSH